MKEVNILIVDDHRLVRDGIKSMLNIKNEKYIFNISEAENGKDAIYEIQASNFNIILLDYQLPDGIGPEIAEKILIFKPKSKILSLSSHDEYPCVLNMKKAGAKGYILKNISPQELILAIETVLSGKKYYSKEIEEHLKFYKRRKYRSKNQQNKFGITRRQMQILKLIADGLTNEDISSKLKLARRTIDTHRQNLLEKLEVNNAASLVKKAVELSILLPNS